MARWLRQSTSADVPIGPFLDSTDGVTAETALTITQPDIRLKKNGAAWAQKNAAQTLTHEENGYYEVTLDATDTDTLGLLRLAVAEAGALPIWEDFLIVPANVWDSFFGADRLQVHADEITAGLITAAAIATDAIDGDAIAASAVTEIQSGLSTLNAAGVRAAVGLASANLDTQIDALPTNAELATATANLDVAVSTRLAAAGYTAPDNVGVAAIKAKTDQLAFGAANAVNANVTHVIANPVQQNGSTSTNWGGAP